jgi:hypothetical protein
MNEKSSCPVLRGRGGGNTILLLDHKGSGLQAPTDEAATTKFLVSVYTCYRKLEQYLKDRRRKVEFV